MTNIRYLLESVPDAHSPLDGIGPVNRKVKHWVAMAGRYPSDMRNVGFTANIRPDVESALIAFADWPRPLIFSGGTGFSNHVRTDEAAPNHF